MKTGTESIGLDQAEWRQILLTQTYGYSGREGRFRLCARLSWAFCDPDVDNWENA